jgi:hypothetical protein
MSLARDVKIYSNGPDALQFLTGRSAILIPRSRSSVTLEPNQDHEEQLQDMCNEVGEGRAIVVYLKGVKRSNMPTQQELESTCVMPVLDRLNDGTIYGLSKKQTNQGSNS